MLARMSKKALALLMVFCMVVSALSVSALAIELNPTEFHIMTLQSIKDKVAEIEGVSSDSVKICTIDVHGYRELADETGAASGGAATHYLVFDDVGYPGLNGSAEYSGIEYWKVLNDAVILDVNQGITGLTVYSRINGTETATEISETYLKTVKIDGKLITEIYLYEPNEPDESTPEEGESVYVYLKAVDGLGQDNGRGYITVGEIKMNLPAANAEYRNGGEERYAQYANDISAALADITRYNNNTIDLSDVNWYTLHCASGADGYVENQEAWHLDGEVRVYNVNYHHNNGTDGVTTDPNGYMAGESFTAMTIENLSYEGHTLLGWSTDPVATAPDTSFAIPAKGGNVDLYAVWQLDETVTETHDAWFFIRTDGVIPIENGTTQYDSKYYKPAHNNNGNGALIGTVDGSAAWTTYYGEIKNGAINGVELSDAFSKVAEHVVTAPTDEAIKTALGNDFDPNTQAVVWYVVKDKSDDLSQNSACPGWHVDGIVYTKGKDPTEVRILNYYRNVEDNESPIAFSVHGLGTKVTITDGITPTRDGYTFTGWNTKPDGSGQDYEAGNIITMNEDVNLYAQWEEAGQKYILQYYYKDNNQLISFKSERYKSGATATVTDEKPTLPGYTFTSWNTKIDGTGTTYNADDEIPMTANVTLYAQWTQNGGTDPQPNTYTVSYVWVGDIPEGVTLPGSASYSADADVTVADVPAVEGYTFSGWNNDMITIRDGKFVMPSYNVILTGIWTKDGGTEPEPTTYTVSYEYAGNVPAGYTAPVDNNKYAKDAEVTVSTAPATIPTNYTFSGWSAEGVTITNGKFSMPEGNVTLTGTWTYTEPTPEPTPDPGPTYNYYRVTVNYLDRADGSKIAESYVSPSHIQGYSYDVSAYDAIAIDGYTYDATEGDPVTGTLNSNKTINVYYMADETEIDDGDTPTSDLPDLPGEGGEVDIDDGQTPTSDLPDTGDSGNSGNTGDTGTDISDEVEIVDEGTPTGSLPQTGTLVQTSATRVALGILALTASLMAAGLAVVLFRKSRKA